MKRLVLYISALLVLHTICLAQNGKLSFRAGGGTIIESSLPGISCALDIKMGKKPVVVTPYFQYFTNKAEGKLYSGLNVQFSRNLSKGLYFGFGGGITQWELKKIWSDINKYTALSISPLMGMRARLTNHLGFFMELKFCFNISQATVNSGSSSMPVMGNVFNHDLPAFLGLSYLF